jgi:hypothetical protein
MAIDADSYCSAKGLSEINMALLNVEDVYSIFDGGSLLYSRTDCFIELDIASLNVTNAKSNLLPES